MKLQRSTIILMFGALLMGGAFYYYETLIIPAQEAKESFAKKLFKFTKEDVKSLLVKTESKTLRFERASEISAPTDLWFMEILEISEKPIEKTETTEETATPENSENSEESATPEEAATTEESTIEATAAESATPEETATSEESTTEDRKNSAQVPEKSSEKIYGNEAYVSFLLEQLVSDRSQQTLTASPEQLKEYELNPPVATIEITLNDQKTHKLTLGKSEFSGNYIYAQVDPPSLDITTQPVMIVSNNFEYAVDRPLEDWKQPAEILEENSEIPPETNLPKNPEKSSDNPLKEAPETEQPAASDSPETTDQITDDRTEAKPDNISPDPTEESSLNSPENSDKIDPEATEQSTDNPGTSSANSPENSENTPSPDSP